MSKKLLLVLLALGIAVVMLFGVRSHNLKIKKQKEAKAKTEAIAKKKAEAKAQAEEEEKEKQANTFDSEIIGSDDDDVSKHIVTITDEVRKKQEKKDEKARKQAELDAQTEPNYPVELRVWDNITVPEYTKDGRRWDTYADTFSLDDFPSKWGKALDHDDVIASKRLIVGTDDVEEGHRIKGAEPISTQELFESKGTFKKYIKKHTAVTFTDLKCVKSLSSDHVALLCTYEWYSVYGFKDEMVIFEDISDTLHVDDIKPGDTFSFTAYGHNISHKTFNGNNILLVEYDTFD